MSQVDTLRFARACILVLGVAQLAHYGTAQGSNEKPLPAFDVASLHLVPEETRVSPWGSTSIGKPTKSCQYLPDRLRCQLSLTSLIVEAYRVKRAEVVRPLWLDDDVIAIEGTMPMNTSQDTVRLMLQEALAERMGLKIHRENRDMTVYALVAAKGGLKLQAADIPAQRKLKKIGSPSGSVSASRSWRPGYFFAMAISLDDLALSMEPCYGIQVPIVNLTGAEESEYKFDMSWPPGEQMGMCVFDDGFPDALEKQHGIRIEKRKMKMDVLVVDQVNRVPTDN